MKKKRTFARIELLPEDFSNYSYLNMRDCPLARALKRHFNTDNVFVFGYGYAEVDLQKLKPRGYPEHCHSLPENKVQWDSVICDRVADCYKDPEHSYTYFVDMQF